ncbi:MAG: hypothetical protein MHM6MM_004283 [Cercozoa sp. M6MM]
MLILHVCVRVLRMRELLSSDNAELMLDFVNEEAKERYDYVKVLQSHDAVATAMHVTLCLSQRSALAWLLQQLRQYLKQHFLAHRIAACRYAFTQTQLHLLDTKASDLLEFLRQDSMQTVSALFDKRADWEAAEPLWSHVFQGDSDLLSCVLSEGFSDERECTFLTQNNCVIIRVCALTETLLSKLLK